MSNTLKECKYYAITTKNGKRIPAQRTAPDEVIKHPLHILYVVPQGPIVLLASQAVVPISKHSTIPLLEKHVCEDVAGVSIDRLSFYCCNQESIEAVLKRLNKDYPPIKRNIDFSKISVEVIQ